MTVCLEFILEHECGGGSVVVVVVGGGVVVVVGGGGGGGLGGRGGRGGLLLLHPSQTLFYIMWLDYFFQDSDSIMRSPWGHHQSQYPL